MLITPHESIAELCAEYGARNILAQVPTAPLEYTDLIPYMALKRFDNTEVGLFTICEGRHIVSDRYKIEFAPTTTRYDKERFYISDFDQLWREGHMFTTRLNKLGHFKSEQRNSQGWLTGNTLIRDYYRRLQILDHVRERDRS